MADILHRVGVNASATKVFVALTTLPGLRGWWIGDAEGDPSRDGVINFRFSTMKVIQAVPTEPVEFMHHCSTKWVTFLLSLRDYVEQGVGRPTPDDTKIHVGD